MHHHNFWYSNCLSWKHWLAVFLLVQVSRSVLTKYTFFNFLLPTKLKPRWKPVLTMSIEQYIKKVNVNATWSVTTSNDVTQSIAAVMKYFFRPIRFIFELQSNLEIGEYDVTFTNCYVSYKKLLFWWLAHSNIEFTYLLNDVLHNFLRTIFIVSHNRPKIIHIQWHRHTRIYWTKGHNWLDSCCLW